MEAEEPKKCKGCGKPSSKWKKKRVHNGLFHRSKKYHYEIISSGDYCSLRCKREHYAKIYRRVPISKETRNRILRRDGYKCRYCGDRATDIDHVFPYSKGGMDTDGNLVASCKACNCTAHDRAFDSFEEKRDWLLKYQRIVKPKPDWHAWVYGGMKSLKK